MSVVSDELWPIFEARRVKAPELKGLDQWFNGITGWFKNKRRILASLRVRAARIEKLEPEIHDLSASHFSEAVSELRDLGRLGRLTGAALDRAMAVAREAAFRALGLRPFKSWARWRCSTAS
jgi:preprotein translocase subunit SecA